MNEKFIIDLKLKQILLFKGCELAVSIPSAKIFNANIQDGRPAMLAEWSDSPRFKFK